jgi:hypothetical protein
MLCTLLLRSQDLEPQNPRQPTTTSPKPLTIQAGKKLHPAPWAQESQVRKEVRSKCTLPVGF